MTKDALMADLEHASRIARDGEDTPLLGGPIGLMWGILMTVVFSVQYMILEQILPVAQSNLTFLWIGFAAIGGFGSFILGRKQDEKPGSNSVANRLEGYVWVMFAGMMFTLATGVILNLLFGNGTYQLWDIMIVIGFAGQGLAYGVVAKMTKLGWLHITALLSFTLSAICFAAFGQTTIYIIAAIGTIFTVILPSLRTMKMAG